MYSWSKDAHQTDPNVSVVDKQIATSEPYVHWFNRPRAAEDTGAPRQMASLGAEDLRIYAPYPAPDPRDEVDAVFGRGALVPLPEGSLNPEAPSAWDYRDVVDALPEVDPDTIIVGIIDTGISLGHRNFRDAAGKTRVISAWQQGAEFDEPAKGWRYLNYPKRRSQLPFGREVVEAEINDALRSSSPDGLTGWLDEDSFNRKLFLVDPRDPTGQRDLDHRAAHGTHILDLASGHVPIPENARNMAQEKIIAVNLPAQYAHGTAGNFLAYFAIYALERILFMADALWLKNNPSSKAAQRGYPVVINFSYGMQAGPKDGSSLFERMLSHTLQNRIEGANSPVRVVMPAGNENLNRGAASSVLGASGQTHAPSGNRAAPHIRLPLQVSPADHTANYLEIWTEQQDTTTEIEARTRIFITPPGQGPIPVPPLQDKTHADLMREEDGALVARLYCQDLPNDVGVRRRYLLCTAPTLGFAKGCVLAPSGTWQIEVHYDGTPVDFAFHVQSDQSGVRQSRTGRRAYFDHPNYDTHVLRHTDARSAVFGGERDSYHYDPILGTDDAEPWPVFGPVQRRGTHNALAAARSNRVGDAMLCIAGYDESSGHPAIYSGTAAGDPNQTGQERAKVSVAFPSETAPNLFGLLAAGAKNGSAVAFRGTSMATALATRHIVERFAAALSGPDLSEIGTEQSLRDEANGGLPPSRKDHWGRPSQWGSARALKVGSERLPTPPGFLRGRVSRL